VVETIRYEEETIALQPNDIMLVYSDGCSEAMNSAGALFGEEEIRSVLQNHRATAASAVVAALLKSTAAHSGKAPQNDDRTVLAVRRCPGSP
jgi:sigma-B regulation protein RsbU (phosphoserine phosphatase)